MAIIYRFGVELTGWEGGPGRNTWHMAQFNALGGATQSDLEAVAIDIAAVYTAVSSLLINGVTATIDSVVEEFEVETGALQRAVGIVAPPPVVGSASSVAGALSRATQATVRLRTDAIRRNRVLQGRHFIGPISTTAMTTSGQIDSGDAGTIGAAYGGVLDVVGNARLVVWGQPNPDVPGLETGVFGYVQSATCNTVPGTLRSRKV